jgi:hypothetical protein
MCLLNLTILEMETRPFARGNVCAAKGHAAKSAKDAGGCPEDGREQPSPERKTRRQTNFLHARVYEIWCVPG